MLQGKGTPLVANETEAAISVDFEMGDHPGLSRDSTVITGVFISERGRKVCLSNKGRPDEESRLEWCDCRL